jgi:hypothetical protein
MYPGSFIWKRLDDGWLMSKNASVLFALSALVIIGMTIVLSSNIDFQNLGLLSNILGGMGGVLAALSIFFLWGGMWRYWIRCDFSPTSSRRFWFMVLLVGMWFGAIVYYAFVYVRQIRLPRSTQAGGL